MLRREWAVALHRLLLPRDGLILRVPRLMEEVAVGFVAPASLLPKATHRCKLARWLLLVPVGIISTTISCAGF